MHFSIIIPTFNSAKYIGKCLEGIQHLDYSKEEYTVILVDGGSTDNTLSIVQTFSEIELLRSNNSSISNSRNIGAKEAKSEILVFIDSDCYVDSQLLKKSYSYLKSYQCCGGFYKAHRSHGWISKTWLMIENKPIGLVSWITAGTLAISREIFFAVGGFNEDLHTSEDLEFGMRLNKHKYKIYNDPSIGSIHLGQADNLIEFFKKEMWRGKSFINGLTLLKQKDIKEIAFDGMILTYFLVFVSLAISTIFLELKLIVYFISILFIIPILLTLRKIPATRTCISILRSFLLIFSYLSARSTSILYYNQLVNFFVSKRIRS